MSELHESIIKLLNDNQIEYASSVSIDDCIINKKYLLPPETKSVILFIVPYLPSKEIPENKNISIYSAAPDYHIFLRDLFGKINNKIKVQYPNINLSFFSDHSPIKEVDAAAKAGIGIIGKNGLLINEKYGSYVFIGDIYTSQPYETKNNQLSYCKNCNLCENSCPSKNNCLSAVTQKKGELNEDEKKLMIKHNTVWGCDICQKVCPYNNDIKTSPIDYFNKNLIYHLNSKILGDMTEEDFKKRAYSWRGINIIRRNIEILYGTHK